MLKDGPVWALGMMSGTSLDGVDAAMLLTDGVSILEFGETGYRPYTDLERAVLQASLGKWDDTDEAAEIVEERRKVVEKQPLPRISSVRSVAAKHEELLDITNNDRKVKDELEDKIKAAIDGFATDFA